VTDLPVRRFYPPQTQPLCLTFAFVGFAAIAASRSIVSRQKKRSHRLLSAIFPLLPLLGGEPLLVGLPVAVAGLAAILILPLAVAILILIPLRGLIFVTPVVARFHFELPVGVSFVTNHACIRSHADDASANRS
jgi:hypothetical protein